MPKFLLIIIFTSISFIAHSQSITITGRILDDDTEEGLPFSDVYFEGTNSGVSSDMDGYYEITTDEYSDSISVSAMGYTTSSKPISSNPEQTINFRLKGSDFALTEVVVSAGENPANRIVRQIIANKKKNRIDNQKAYECEAYSKLELDLDNIERLKNTKLMKPFSFVFDNVDSLSDEKPYLPAYILEEIHDISYVKGQGQPKKMIRASKVSGVENQTVNDFLSSAQAEYNVYDNWINILEKPFAFFQVCFIMNIISWIAQRSKIGKQSNLSLSPNESKKIHFTVHFGSCQILMRSKD